MIFGGAFLEGKGGGGGEVLLRLLLTFVFDDIVGFCV